MLHDMDIDELVPLGTQFKERLLSIKASINPAPRWYPYDTLGNLVHLAEILKEPYRDLSVLSADMPVLDIGCADGDLGFFFESLGHEVHFVDFAPTNYNHLEGLEALRLVLRSNAAVDGIDVDRQFHLERQYGLTLCLGLLYHVRNPFYLMTEIARVSRYCVLSTRVFRTTKDRSVSFEGYPVAYLVEPDETNNDPSNFWMFTEAGLRRLMDRSGWEILSFGTVGVKEDSDPSSPERDERAFCLLRRKGPRSSC